MQNSMSPSSPMSILASHPNLLFLSLSLDGRILSTNQPQRTGEVGTFFADHIASGAAAYQQLLGAGGCQSSVLRLAAEGRQCWYQFQWVSDPAQACIHGVGMDISEQQRNERLLTQLQKASRVAGWEFDLRSGELYWTNAMWQLHELQPGSVPLTAESVMAYYVPGSRDVVRQAVMAAVGKGESYRLEMEIVTAQGRRVWVEASGEVIREHGRPLFLYGALQEITERRNFEQALRESERQLSLVFEQMTDQLLLFTVEHGTEEFAIKLTLFNRAFEVAARQAGETDLHSLIGKPLEYLTAEPFPWGPGRLDRQQLDHLIRSGQSLHYRLPVPEAGLGRMRDAVLTPLMDSMGICRHILWIGRDMEVRWKAEAELRAQGEFLERILERIGDGVIATDANGLIRFQNRAAERITGWKGLAGRKLGEVLKVELEPGHQLRANITTPAGPIALIAADGSRRPVEMRTASLQDGDGILVVLRDLSEQQLAEQRLEIAKTASELGFWEWSIPNDHAIQDPEWLKKAGFDKSAERPSILDSLRRNIHREDLPLFERALSSHLTGASDSFDVEYRILSNNELRWLRAVGRVVTRDEQAKPLRMLGTVMDITRQKSADALQGRWQSLVMTSPDIIMLTDARGSMSFINRPECDHMKGWNIARFTPTASLIVIKEAMGQVLAGEPWVEYEGDTYTPTALAGTWLTRLVRLGPDELMFVSRDITERKQVDRALRSSEAHHRTVLEAAPDSIITVDGMGNIRTINRATEAMFGYPRDQAVGMRLKQLLPDTPPRGRPWPVNMEAAWGMHADGHRFPVEISAAEATVDGEVIHTGVIKDITERQQQKTRLMLTDRLASLGMLSAGLVHEISTPLTNILSNLDYLQSAPGLGRSSHVETVLTEATRSGEQIRELVYDLRLYTRGEDTAHGASDLLRVIQWVLRLTRREIERSTRLLTELERVPLVVGSELKLSQIFTNLVVNAIQAMPANALERNELRVRVYRHANGQVVGEIADNGPGIPPEVRDRIFEPFFTTKPPGEGTGLGLAICRSILVALGGSIEVDTAPGKGTTFRVMLPVSGGRSEAPALLVVSPDAETVRTVQRRVEGRYEVMAETEPRQALEKIKAGANYAAILYDLRTPGLPGASFLMALQAKFPEMAGRCIFLVGIGDEEFHPFVKTLSMKHRIEKPVTTTILLERLGTMQR